MEKAWFDDLALHRWIDSDDHVVLETVFRVLPSRLFANLCTLPTRTASDTGVATASARRGAVAFKIITSPQVGDGEQRCNVQLSRGMSASIAEPVL
jgi:hypothetical protein